MTRGVIKGKDASTYDIRKRASSKHAKSIEKFLWENTKTGKSVRVCDFCCGTGIDIDILKNKTGEIFGIDVSSDMIKICKRKFGNNKKIKLKTASVTDTKLKKEYFDYVIIRMGLHHVKDKEAVMNEAYRILKPKGKFIIIDKYYLNLFEIYSKALYKLIFKGKLSAFDEYVISKKENERLFFSNKFKVVKRKMLPYYKEHIGQSFMYVLQKC